ncbi:P-loop containing nucleoside triphosphate hydrolase protein [Dendryphion nanum]|uniref:P-loop containing nucleoside triphosphate hydrolase protein n=1 Tax=Dendryphion nanum TaxID=256645 RepID=A0A9P9D479_9PLEO|nr:P-loop containing nucleoside triphosphate hydrolase protein [Dendryphion nanum]
MKNKVVKKTIVVLGEPGVGKTCFCDRFTHDALFVLHNPTENSRRQGITLGEVDYNLSLIDADASLLRDPDPNFHSMFFVKWLYRADGIILLYDITSKTSFDHIIDDGYLNLIMSRRTHDTEGIPYMCGAQRFGCVLVGNKADLAAEKREVSRELAQEWAQTHGIKSIELDTSQTGLINEAMTDLICSILHAEQRDVEDVHKVKKLGKKRLNDLDAEVYLKQLGKDSNRMSSLSRSFRQAFRK